MKTFKIVYYDNFIYCLDSETNKVVKVHEKDNNFYLENGQKLNMEKCERIVSYNSANYVQ